MADLLQQAIERRDALRAELEAVEQVILLLSRRDNERAATTPDLFGSPQALRGTRATRAAAVTAMMDDAERLIIEEGRPLTRFDLLARLLALGHVVEGGDQSKVLGTNLWRSRRFHNIEGAGYWPRREPIPPPFDNRPLRSSMLS